MRRVFVCLFFALMACMTYGQRISKTFKDVSLSEALVALGKEDKSYSISFIYNELEDYRVTCRVKGKTLPEAVNEVIGLYPITMQLRENRIFVEAMYKTNQKLIGRLTDEKERPVAYANISLLHPVDSSLLMTGVSNQNGRFAIPCNEEQALVHITHVGHQPLYKLLPISDIGTLHLKTATHQLSAVDVGKEETKKEGWQRRYDNFAERIRQQVWTMDLPQFQLTTCPEEYREEPAVILAEYDSLEHRRIWHYFPMLPNGCVPIPLLVWESWIHSQELFRRRILFNNEEGIERYAWLTRSRNDISEDGLGIISPSVRTVGGVRILKPDGQIVEINVDSLFAPKGNGYTGRRGLNNETTVDIRTRIEGVEVGDILDMFIYRKNKSGLPKTFDFAQEVPVVSLDYKVVADRDLNFMTKQFGRAPSFQKSKTEGGDHLLSFQRQNWHGMTGDTACVKMLGGTPSAHNNPQIARRKKGLVENPSLATVMEGYFSDRKADEKACADFRKQQAKQKKNRKQLAPYSCYEYADSIGKLDIPVREKADSIYVHLTSHHISEFRFYYDIKYFYRMLMLANIPFVRGAVSPVEDIEGVLGVSDLKDFVRLEDGTVYIIDHWNPISHVPGEVDENLRGRRAILEDLQTIIVL